MRCKMKSVEFVKLLRNGSKYTKKDDWNLIINAIKNLKLGRPILEKISKVLLSENLKDKDISLILNN